MARDFLSVRLSYDAKYFIEKLKQHKQELLDKELANDLIERIEKDIVEKYVDELDCVSTTIILKVSSASIIENAYQELYKKTPADWETYNSLMLSTKIDGEINVGSQTPRMFLKLEVIKWLESLQETFKTDKGNNAKMSYVIKCVAHASYLENKEKMD